MAEFRHMDRSQDAIDDIMRESADRIEDLERQLATEKAIIGECMWTPAQLHEAITAARREALEQAAAKVDGLRSILGQSYGEITHARAFIKDLLRDLSSAIRALSDSIPTLLQEQNANGRKDTP
jgi:chromosome segregation ATPase